MLSVKQGGIKFHFKVFGEHSNRWANVPMKLKTGYLYTYIHECVYIKYKKGIYIYIYIYVYLGSISSLMQISLNIIDILCLHILFWIRSNSRITFIVFGGN